MSDIECEAADMAATYSPEALARQVIGERAARVAAQADEASVRQQLEGAVDALRDLLEWVDLIVERRPGLGDIIVIANARRIVAERELLNP